MITAVEVMFPNLAALARSDETPSAEVRALLVESLTASLDDTIRSLQLARAALDCRDPEMALVDIMGEARTALRTLKVLDEALASLAPPESAASLS